MFAWILVAMVAWAESVGGTADMLTYPLGPGDEVRLEVVGEPEMSGLFRVNSNGTIDVPYAGTIAVTDLTVDQATSAVLGQLARTVLLRPQIVLTVEAFNSRRVEVSGGVVKPGTYSLQKGRTRVSEMLTRAEGLAELSAPRAQIYREIGGVRTPIDVNLEAIYNGDPMADMEVRAGDQLYVPPVESVYVDGQVGKPGAYAYRDGMTLSQAVAQAGSALNTARLPGVYIMRGSEKIAVNLKRVQRGDEADVSLRPSDRVFVPESAF